MLHACRRLYKLSTVADDAYQAELIRTYGSRACDARYDYRLNQATDMLRLLSEASRAANDARHNAAVENLTVDFAAQENAGSYALTY